jgi:hypothetical protein
MSISEGELTLPQTWHASIEKSKEKARKLLRKVVALDMTDSIVIGVLEDVMVDKLFRVQCPFIKLTLQKVKKYDTKEKLINKIDEQIFFINKPQMIMDVKEIADRFPEIFQDVHVEMRKGVY